MEEPRMTPKALGKKVVLCPEMRSKYVCWGVGGRIEKDAVQDWSCRCMTSSILSSSHLPASHLSPWLFFSRS